VTLYPRDKNERSWLSTLSFKRKSQVNLILLEENAVYPSFLKIYDVSLFYL